MYHWPELARGYLLLGGTWGSAFLGLLKANMGSKEEGREEELWGRPYRGPAL